MSIENKTLDAIISELETTISTEGAVNYCKATRVRMLAQRLSDWLKVLDENGMDLSEDSARRIENIYHMAKYAFKHSGRSQ